MTEIKDTATHGQQAVPVALGKKVLLAAPRGYCAGVDRAVIAVEKALDHYGSPVYVRKQIVHNKHVVSSLEKWVRASNTSFAPFDLTGYAPRLPVAKSYMTNKSLSHW